MDTSGRNAEYTHAPEVVEEGTGERLHGPEALRRIVGEAMGEEVGHLARQRWERLAERGAREDGLDRDRRNHLPCREVLKLNGVPGVHLEDVRGGWCAQDEHGGPELRVACGPEHRVARRAFAVVAGGEDERLLDRANLDDVFVVVVEDEEA